MVPSMWFFQTFTPEEIRIIDQVWSQQVRVNVLGVHLDMASGHIAQETGGVVNVPPLSETIDRHRDFNGIFPTLTRLLFRDHRDIASKCVSSVLERDDVTPLNLHFYLTEVAEMYYSVAHEIEQTINYCNMVVSLAPQAAAGFQQELRHAILPAHKAYERLCIIYEKKCNYAEAIKMAEQALSEGWSGDWQNRIDRCNSRIKGVAHKRKPSSEPLRLTPVIIDGREVMAWPSLDESKANYVHPARAYGRSHPICRFCHKENTLNDGACPACFEKSFRYRETERKLVRCVVCKDLKPTFESRYGNLCEGCFNDRKGAFCARREGNFEVNDNRYPYSGCVGCGQDKLVNGWGYCADCYIGVCAIHPVRLCTRCDQYGLNNHIKRVSIFADTNTKEDVWKKDLELAVSEMGNVGWTKRFRVAEDVCDICWKAARRARKQKSDLHAAVRNLRN